MTRVREDDFPPFVCPRCRDPVEDAGDAYACPACGADYPVVAGIPDFRVFPDPWIGLEADREKALRVARRTEGADLETALRTYWDMTPSTPRERAREFIEHCLRARERSEEWFEEIGRDGTTGSDGSGGWLDLGTGTGDLAAVAAARGASVVGVDIALRWLVVARRRPGVGDTPRIRLVCACAEALPFPDASFGRILSLGLLAHVTDPDAVAAEAHRVLDAGGRIDLRTVNRYTLLREPHTGVWGVGFLPRRWTDPYVRWRTGRSYERHRPLSPREVRRVLRGGGFAEVRVEAAPTLSAEAERLPGPARRVVPLYERARRTPGLRSLARWTAPLLEAGARRP